MLKNNGTNKFIKGEDKMADFEKLMKELLTNGGGCSVTQRIKKVKQPRGGFINPKVLSATPMGDGAEALNPEENVHPSLMGLAVDYMTRFISGASVEESFKISEMGAHIISKDKKAKKLMSGIKGLDDTSIINAVKLSGFDVVCRAGIMGYKPVEEINPDAPTISNIRTMVERSISFLEQYGPKILDGFTFEGGYTSTVSDGDGDFTTEDTLWDFKVSKMPVKKEHTLQLLMYWRMGLHSIHTEFQGIKYLGIYNPRMNIVYRIKVIEIPDDIISDVEIDVIGYEK
ncbi:MAG: hypothetical protein LBG82_02895 [Clostridiales Family XIII bacterium]|jgi:hypothetical protein|nr:hypothetical protein [Clostridiales Family XIII bacterium]